MYDLVISDGTIIDGTGAPAYTGSIGINESRIEHISAGRLYGKHTVDARGLTVAPGFIDVHTHSDISFLTGSRMESKIFQGVTTEIVGNCGVSVFPAPDRDDYYKLYRDYISGLLTGADRIKERFKDIGDYRNMLSESGMAVNCGIMVGHGTLRICAMGFEDRKPTGEDMDKMKKLLDFQIKHGALGMSLGLIYPPGSFAGKQELTELAGVIKAHDAVLAVHLRNENDGIFEAVKEMTGIAKATGVHVHISHLKLMGELSRNKAGKLLSLIDIANREGAVVTCDQYPYSASSTTLAVLVPSPIHQGGTGKMLKRLREKPAAFEQQIEKHPNMRECCCPNWRRAWN